MTVEERVSRLEARLGANDDLVRELRDAMTATAYMEARQSRAIKEHSEWLVEHERGLEEARRERLASRRDFDDRMKRLDERIEGLVGAFGAFLRREPNR